MSMLLDPPIALKGELTLADVLTANRLLESQRPRKYTGGIRACFAALAVAFAITASGFDEPWVAWGVAGALAVAAAVYFVPSLKTRLELHRSWKRKEGVFRQVDTTIAPEGLRIAEPHATITVEWPHFVGALMGPTTIFLFPKEGWILFGRSRFTDERDWNRFKAFVEDRWPVRPRFV